MSLSNIPDYLLIQEVNAAIYFGRTNDVDNFDHELDLRRPDIAMWYFGDCAGELIFIPCEPEYDGNGQPIINEVIGYDEGEEIWLNINS